MRLSPVWLSILSDLLVNIAAALFSVAFIEAQLSSFDDLVSLTTRVIFGIFSLLLAKQFRERSKRR